METQLEDVYGPLAAHREHNPAEHIRYRLAGEPGEYSGKIL
jgi:hypothetical protein